MHNYASLITTLRSIKPTRHATRRLSYGYHPFQRFVTSVFMLLCTTTALGQSTSEELTFEVSRIEVGPERTTLLGPIMLDLAHWQGYALSGSTESSQDCANVYRLSDLTVTDHRRQWARIHSATYCKQSARLDVMALHLQLGDAHLTIAHLNLSYPSSSPLHLTDATLSCGRLMPLSLTAKSGQFGEEQVILEDITLKVGAVPLGWFPVLDISKSGRAGLLPPSLSVQSNRLRIGLPVYIPIGPFQDVTLAPTIELQPSSHQLLSRAVYRWHQRSGMPGSLTVLGNDQFLSVHSSGHARKGKWRITTHGHSRLGKDAIKADPNLSIENLSGFSRGQVALNWRHQNAVWGLGLDRSMSDTSAMHSFSRVQHHVSISKRLRFGELGFGNTTQLRLEPTSIWLSRSTLALMLNKRWWGLSTENQTYLDLQHSTQRPLRLNTHTDLGVGTLRNEFKLKSLWARDYERTTHTIGVQSFADTIIRSAPSLSDLDTRLNPSARFNRRISAGLFSSNEWSSLTSELHLNAVHIGQSQYSDDHFAELKLKIDHPSASLSTTYAHERSVLVSSKVFPSRPLSLNTTYFARREGILPMDMLFVDVTKNEPTVGHHVHWQTRDSRISGSIWLPQDHSRAHAGALGWSLRPECECFRWTTALKYTHQTDNLWLTFQLELDLESSQL